jgi:hypothetical protein
MHYTCCLEVLAYDLLILQNSRFFRYFCRYINGTILIRALVIQFEHSLRIDPSLINSIWLSTRVHDRRPCKCKIKCSSF